MPLHLLAPNQGLAPKMDAQFPCPWLQLEPSTISPKMTHHTHYVWHAPPYVHAPLRALHLGSSLVAHPSNPPECLLLILLHSWEQSGATIFSH